mmetsp:Transcript_69215/g.123233  ORF Transcript_69215/g.123233 Transcript_69215/m.123233 type:complete len:156 (-) Transcript_69215:29-496(-)
MAPEGVKCTGYNNGADWWTLGCLLFELMSGKAPFTGKTPTQIYEKIFAGIEKVSFDTKMKGSFEELVKKLCHDNSAKRIAMLPGGATNVKKNLWYKGFDWESMEQYSLQAPFKPEVKGKTDMSNFKKEISHEIPSDMKYVPDESNNWDAEFATAQ